MIKSVQYSIALAVSGLIWQEMNLECLEYWRFFPKLTLFCKILKEEVLTLWPNFKALNLILRKTLVQYTITQCLLQLWKLLWSRNDIHSWLMILLSQYIQRQIHVLEVSKKNIRGVFEIQPNIYGGAPV